MDEGDREKPGPDGYITDELTRLAVRMDEVLKPLVEDLGRLLAEAAGKSLGGLEQNVAFARTVQGLLQRLGLRVECPRCGEPAFLRCLPGRGAKAGTFQFQHQEAGRSTHHGGSVKVPLLKFVPAPPDRRRIR